jgi:hypothetical protein
MTRYPSFDWWMPIFLGLGVSGNEITRVFCCIHASTGLHPRSPVIAGEEDVRLIGQMCVEVPPSCLNFFVLTTAPRTEVRGQEVLALLHRITSVHSKRGRNLSLSWTTLQILNKQNNTSPSNCFGWISWKIEVCNEQYEISMVVE